PVLVFVRPHDVRIIHVGSQLAPRLSITSTPEQLGDDRSGHCIRLEASILTPAVPSRHTRRNVDTALNGTSFGVGPTLAASLTLVLRQSGKQAKHRVRHSRVSTVEVVGKKSAACSLDSRRDADAVLQ